MALSPHTLKLFLGDPSEHEIGRRREIRRGAKSICAVPRSRIHFFNGKCLPDFAAAPAPASTELGYEIALLQRRVVIARAGTEPEKTTLLSAALAPVAVNLDHKALLKQSLAVDVDYMPTWEAFAIMHNDLGEMRKIVQALAKN